ncbi:hypothetical protein IFM89_002117 [Coptis chinensis]|uniref:tRNA dimethylallyltransferase 2 n=1 Tax=Coptis chinensis TaxID=261450 RepID=A0A835H3U4_9MAGN|nr:hypothetical protein IFM89_002117 [Coptis chinensis]
MLAQVSYLANFSEERLQRSGLLSVSIPRLKPSLIIIDNSLILLVAGQNWGRADDFRYDCCFICLDASVNVLDQYVEQRVDCMIDAGLLNEVYDIFTLHADYTRGLRQAIGVREFEDFLKCYLVDKFFYANADGNFQLSTKENNMLKENLKTILDCNDSQQKVLLVEAISKLKTNTKRLVRRQRRRLNRLQTLFGWELHYVDTSEALLGKSHDSWARKVIEPSIDVVKFNLYEKGCLVSDFKIRNSVESQILDKRDLWTQHICEPCGNRLLRGAHEWEQHKQGRGHRKRILGLRKSKQFLADREVASVTGEFGA